MTSSLPDPSAQASAAMAATNADRLTIRYLDEQTGRLISRATQLFLLGLLPLAIWVWAAPLSSAVIAPAVVKIEQNRRPVQHAEGGIVAEVKVRDGDTVKAGQTILVLGDVSVAADASRLANRSHSERVTIARLESEQSLQSEFEVPADLLRASKQDPQLASLIRKERALFGTRSDALTSQRRLMRDQKLRISEEVAAIDLQLAALEQALRFQRDELATNRGLQKSGFISSTRITQLEAGVANYDASLQERRSERVRTQQRRLDLDLRIKALESSYRQQASDELKAASTRLADLQQELLKTSDAKARQIVVAPVDGQVMDLRFHAPGSVVGAREPIADIVPINSHQLIEARVATSQISQVHLGQSAQIHLLAYRSRAVDRVEGHVVYIGADRQIDEKSRADYYIVRIETSPEALKRAGDLSLQPGMPAEVFIEGEARTVLAYLMEPVAAVIHRAGRE